MTSGSGDEFHIVFTVDGAVIRVFAHESPMTPFADEDRELWPGLLDGLPDVFRSCVEDPALADEDGQFVATAVLWRLTDDDRWRHGDSIEFPPPVGPYDYFGLDGAGLLEILGDDIVDRYLDFAGDYYETDVDRAAVEHVVAQRTLTEAVVHALNPALTLADLRDAVTATGYPA